MTLFHTNLRFTPYLYEPESEPRSWVFSVGEVSSYGHPASDATQLHGFEPVISEMGAEEGLDLGTLLDLPSFEKLTDKNLLTQFTLVEPKFVAPRS